MVKITISVKFSSILCLLVLVSGLYLSSSFIVAEGENGGGENSCTLSYSTDASHEVTMLNGNYTKDLGASTFSAICDDDAGFSIYTVGYSNNKYGNNKMAATVDDTATPEYDIATGTAISGDTSNWAMKISAVAGDYAPTIEEGFSSYTEIPDTYEKTVSYTASTDDTIGSSLQTTYAVYISGAQPAGTYTGQVKYLLLHPHTEEPCGSNNICYKPNSKNVDGTMGKQSAEADTDVMLLASNYSRAGYGFAGWNTESDLSGTTYGPNETITTPDDMSEGLTLYAVWVKSAGNLQDWDGCYELDEEEVTALTDRRDGDVYAVAKLADGKCWMIENLRLDAEDSVGNNKFDSSVTNESLAQGYAKSSKYGNFVGLAEPESSNYSTKTANSIYYVDAPVGTAYIGIGTMDAAGLRMPRYNNTNTSARAVSPTNGDNRIYSYGNYYTWHAAIANTMYYTSVDSVNPDGNTSETSKSSICPKGWRLPSGGAKSREDVSDFWSLVLNVNEGVLPASYNDSSMPTYSDSESVIVSKRLRSYPNNFVTSGDFTMAHQYLNGGLNGFYWSSNSYNNNSAFRLNVANRYAGLGDRTEVKSNGNTIRCVTDSLQRHSLVVSFDDGVTEVILHSDKYDDIVVNTSGTAVTVLGDVEYTISATYTADDVGLNSWETTANGILGSQNSPITTYTISGNAELSLTSKEVCPSGKVCYKRNDTNIGTLNGTMGRQDISGTSAVLMASNFSNTEYGFAGWNTQADGSGTSYGPNETIHFTDGAYSSPNYGLMLYAMWVPSAGTLQNWSCPLNSEMPIGTVTALTDFRDNQVYAVAKLADGKCWMIENMRLESEYTVGNNANNSHYTNESLAQGYAPSNGYGAFIGLADAEQSGFSSAGGSNSIYSSDGTGIVDIEHIDAPGYRMPRYNNTNTSAPASEPADGQTSIYSYGNYYTWHAAIADTSYYDNNNLNVDETSICPAGWGLPTGGMAYTTGSTTGVNVTGNELTYRDFYNLGYKLMNNTTAYEDTPNNGQAYYDTNEAFRKYPNNFVYSGIYDGSAAYNRGTQANYWAATTSGNDDGASYELYLDQDAWPGTKTELTYKAGSIRCVDKTVSVGLDGLEYMQDFADLTPNEMDALKDSMVEGKQYTIKDSRDNKTYYISKLADGNIWMTQDLDHDIVTTTDFYTYENTDIGHGDVQNTAATWTASTATYETGNTTWVDGGNGNYIPQSYDPGEVVWDGMTDTYWYTTLDNMQPGTDSHYRIGNYYDWTAAVAMNDSSAYTDGEIDQSICPAGWTLPRGGLGDNSSGTFRYLLTQYGYDENVYQALDPRPWDSPLYYSYGGFWRGYSDVVASFAYYWSSSVDGSTGAHNLVSDPDATSISTSGGYSRSDGLNVRCIARTPKAGGVGNLTYMQDFAGLTASEMDALKASMVEGEQYTVKDSRDNKSYYISKLADGNIWMTQNLDFDIGSTTLTHNSTTLYHDDTDLGYGTSTNQSWTAATATFETGNTAWDVDMNGNYTPESYDPGNKIWNGVIDSNWNTTLDNMPQGIDMHYHIGNYYNWTAAVAINDSNSYTTGGVDLDQSVCPAGWTLPKGGDDAISGSFKHLVELYGWNSSNYKMENPHMWEAPLYFTLSGYWYRESGEVASAATYYSSTTYSDSGTYYISGDLSGNVFPDGGYRFMGYSVRCIARTPKWSINDLEYMQDFATLSSEDKAEVLDSMIEGEQYQLTDSRDDKVYYISKLEDGNVWMTQNLDFDIVNGGADIDSTNTDVPANWTDAGNLTDTYTTYDPTWVGLLSAPESFDPGDVCWNGTMNPVNMGVDDLTYSCSNDHYHLGNYYNWTAAVALSDSSSYTTDDYDLDQSICPAGWMLPKTASSAGSGSFVYLENQAGLTAGVNGSIHQDPYYFVYGGLWHGTSYGIGIGGLYWSSIPQTDYYAYSLIFEADEGAALYSNTTNERGSGQSVRCVVR